jgi:hypothetical protein
MIWPYRTQVDRFHPLSLAYSDGLTCRMHRFVIVRQPLEVS